jgi:hypothetical protein
LLRQSWGRANKERQAEGSHESRVAEYVCLIRPPSSRLALLLQRRPSTKRADVVSRTISNTVAGSRSSAPHADARQDLVRQDLLVAEELAHYARARPPLAVGPSLVKGRR